MMKVQARRLNKNTLFVVTLVALALICGMLFTAIPLNNVLAKAMSVPAPETSDNVTFNFSNFTEGEYLQSSVIELTSATTQTITDFGTADSGNGAYFSSHNSWYSSTSAGVKYLLYFYTFKLSDTLYEALNSGNYTVTISGTSTTNAVSGNSDTFSYLYIGLGYASNDDVVKSLNGYNEIKATVGTGALKIPQETSNANPNTISDYDFSSTTGVSAGSGYKYLRVGMYSRPWNREGTDFNINLSNIVLTIAPMAPTMSMPSDYNTNDNMQWTQTEMVEYVTQPSNSIETISSLDYSDTVDTFTSIDNTTKFVSSSNGKFTASDTWSYSSAPGGSLVLYHIGFMHTYKLTDTIYNSLLNNMASLSLSMSADIYDKNQSAPDARLWLYAGIGTASSDSAAVRYNGFKQVQARYNSHIYYTNSNDFSNVGLDTYFQASSSNTGYKYLRIAFLTEVWPGGSTNDLSLSSVRIHFSMEEKITVDTSVPTTNSMTKPSGWGSYTFYDDISNSSNFCGQTSMVEIGNSGNSLTSSNTSLFPTSGNGISRTGWGQVGTSGDAVFSNISTVLPTDLEGYSHKFNHVSGSPSQGGFFYTLKLSETVYNALMSGAISISLETPNLSASGLGSSGAGRVQFVSYLGIGYAANDDYAKNGNAFIETKGYVGGSCTYYASGSGYSNESATNCNIPNFNFTNSNVVSKNYTGNGNTKYLRFGVWGRFYVSGTDANCSNVKLTCGPLNISLTPTSDYTAPNIPSEVTGSSSVTITDASGLNYYTINGRKVQVAKISNTSFSANTTITLPEQGTYNISAVDIWGNASSTVSFDYFYANVVAQANTDGIQNDYAGGKIVFNSSYNSGNGYRSQQITNSGPYNSNFNIWAKPNDGYYFAGFTLGNHYSSINLDLSTNTLSDTTSKSGSNGSYKTINGDTREYMFSWNAYTNIIIPADGKIYITANFKAIPTTNNQGEYDKTAKTVTVGAISNAPNKGSMSSTVSYSSSIAPTSAGTYTATSTIKWNNVIVGVKTEDIVISPKNIVATYSQVPSNIYYRGTTDVSDLISYTFESNAICSGDTVVQNASATLSDKNVGERTIAVNATLSGVSSANYNITNATPTFNLTIVPTPVTVIFTTMDKDYDGNKDATVGVNVEGVIAGESIIYDTTATYADKNAGVDKKVTLTNPVATAGDGTLLANYNITTNADELVATINKIQLNVSYNLTTEKIYDGNVTANVTDVAVSGYAIDDNLRLSPSVIAVYEGADVSNSVKINITISVEGDEKDNYYWNTSASTTGIITIRELTISAIDNSKVYGESDPELLYSIGAPGFVNEEDKNNANVQIDRADGENVGDYDIIVSVNNSNHNYNLKVQKATFSISARPIIVTLQEQSGIYGDTLSVSQTAYDTSAKNGYEPIETDDLGVIITKDGDWQVGSYELSASATNTNYEVEFVINNSYVVVKRDLVITLNDNQGSVYGEQIVVDNTAFTAPNLATGDRVEIIITKADGTNAGSYLLSGALDTESEYYANITKNYNVSFATDKVYYVISARVITIVIAPQECFYGDEIIVDDTMFSVDTTEGKNDLASGEDKSVLAIDIIKEDGLDAKDYALSFTWDNDNYDVSGANGVYTIKKATLTATYAGETITYGGTPVGNVVYSGYKYTDNDSVVTTKATVDFTKIAYTGNYITANLEGYELTPAGASANNYNFNYLSGKLIVEKAELEITYTEDITYGGTPVTDITSNKFVVSGLLDGDTESVISVVANLPSNAGSYSITSNEFSFSAINYDVSAISGTLNIDKAPLEITISAPLGLYYGDEIALTITYGTQGKNFVNGEDADDLTSKVIVDFAPIKNEKGYVNANASGYDLSSVITEATSSNYEITHTVGKLFISKKTLTLTYQGESRTYNALLPTPDKAKVTSSGMVEEDGIQYLTESEGFDFNLAVNGPAPDVGQYLVYANYVYEEGRTALTNYNITFNRDYFVITKASLTATYVGETIVFGATPVGNVEYSGFMGEDDVKVLNTAPAVDFSAITQVTIIGENSYINANESGYSIAPSSGNDNNYEISYENGTLIVEKRSASLVLENQGSVYGENVEVAQGEDYYTVSGLLDGDSLTSVNIVIENAGVTVGDYVLDAEVVGDNYATTVTTAKYVISKAILNVTIAYKYAYVLDVEVVNITDGDFEIVYTNYVYNDDESLLDTPVSIDVDAIKASIDGAGEYDIKYFEGEDDQYNFNYVNIGTIVVTASEIDVDISGLSFQSQTFIYNGEARSIYVNWEDKPQDVDVEISYTYSNEPCVNAGSYQVVASFKVLTAGYKDNIADLEATLTISPIDVEITLAPQGSVYGKPVVVGQGGEYYTVSAGTVLENEDLGVVITKSDVMNANHGEYNLDATITNTNYNLVNVVTSVYTISSVEVTVTLRNQSGEYGKSAVISQTEYDITVGELVEASDMVITLSVENRELYEVGESYDINAEIVDNPWYVFTIIGAKYIVVAKNIQITLANVTAKYGDIVDATTTYTITAGSLVDDSDDLALEFSITQADKYVVGGDYVISATSLNTNYVVDVVNAKYFVDKKYVEIQVADQYSTYGESYVIKNDFALVDGYTLVVGDTNEDLGVKVIVNSASLSAGNYVLSANVNSANYDVKVHNGNYEIKKAETILYTDKLQKSYDYTGNAISFKTATSYVYTNREDSQANIKLPTTQVINAGTYKLTFSINESTNYKSASVEVEIVVNKIAPEVNMSALLSKTYVYNGKDQHITAEKEALLIKADFDEVSLSWKNNTFNNVPEGGKQVVELVLSETTNYTAKSFTQEVTIYKSRYDFTGLNYTFTSLSTAYDGKEHYIEVVNLPEGITVAYSYDGVTQLEPIRFKNAGTYVVEAIYTYDEVNYERPTEFIYSSHVQIERINITVEVVDQHGYYGYAPEFDPDGVNVIAGNFITGDEIDLKLELEPKESYPIGVYKLVANTTSSGNYNVTIAKGSYTILPRPITVTIDNKTSQYGDTDVPYTFQVTAGELVQGDVLNAALVRQEGKVPGEYTISGTVVNPNYVVTVNSGIYTITPRVITVEVFNQEGTSAKQINKRAYKTFGKIMRGDNLNIQVVGEVGDVPGEYVLSATYTDNPNYEVIIKEGIFTLRKVAKISVANPFVYKLYDGVPYVFDVEVSSGATPIFSLDGIYVENSFTEVGVYNLSINAEVIGDYASPEPYRITFEIRPTELVAEKDGVIVKVVKEDGFGAEETIDIQQDLSVTLNGKNYTSKIDTAFTIYVVNGEERTPLEEYMQGEEVHIKVKLNEQLTEIGAETWFVDSNSNVLHEASLPDADGYVEVTLADGNHVLFVTARDEAAPILVVGSGMAAIFLAMGFFFLFRKKFIN